MKKYLSLFSILIFPLFLAGCGTNSPLTTAPAGSSIWKSSDAGKTWEAKNKTAEKINLDAIDVLSLAVNPSDSQNILVGTAKDGILKSDDGGENWSLLNFQSQKVYGLAIDPIDGRMIYASGVWQNRGKLFKSLDSGQNWQEIYTSPSNGPLIISLTVDKINSNILYATTSDNQVLKSEDAGTSWKNIYQAQGPVLKVAVDNVNDNIIYFNVMGGSIFRSKNKGAAGEDISRAVSMAEGSGQGVDIIETDPQNANWVYAAGKIGILRSKDAGNTWEKISTLNDPQAFPVKALAVNPKNSTEIMYGAAQTVYKSLDGGANWITSQFQTARTINVLKYDPADPNVIYMGLRKI